MTMMTEPMDLFKIKRTKRHYNVYRECIHVSNVLSTQRSYLNLTDTINKYKNYTAKTKLPGILAIKVGMCEGTAGGVAWPKQQRRLRTNNNKVGSEQNAGSSDGRKSRSFDDYDSTGMQPRQTSRRHSGDQKRFQINTAGIYCSIVLIVRSLSRD